MLRIYGYAASINVRKVLWTCAELGLPFEREDWAGPFRPTSDPAFLSLNPVGMVPVIDDEGAIVWESNTIVRYLAASRGRTDLLPADHATACTGRDVDGLAGIGLQQQLARRLPGAGAQQPDYSGPEA